MKNRPIFICGVQVQPGERITLALPTPEIYTCAPLHIPMHILHGKLEGPILLVSSTFHGDEVNGIAILQRLLGLNFLKNLKGTLIAIPVMNVYGLINRSSLLPDGRDLESSFPGSEKGSFASRLAYLFSSEVLDLCTHCINIRTGGFHTYKIPHVIYQASSEPSKKIANAFGAPILMPSSDPESFFHRPDEANRPMLVYVGGEPHRTDEWTIRTGVKGIIRVMRDLQMLPAKGASTETSSYSIEKTSWIRASGSGLFNFDLKTGAKVLQGEKLATIVDPFGSSQKYDVLSEASGIIVGVNNHPLVYEGQGIIQIGHLPEELVRPFPVDIPSIQPDLVNN